MASPGVRPILVSGVLVAGLFKNAFIIVCKENLSSTQDRIKAQIAIFLLHQFRKFRTTESRDDIKREAALDQ
jgi:hypothetical protein